MILAVSLLLLILSLSSSQAPRILKPRPANQKEQKLLENEEKFPTRQDSDEFSSCSKPVEKVGFMKLHKTASSTIQNILMRYGMNSGWNFVMYSFGNQLGPPSNQYVLDQPFNSSWLDNVPWYNMTQEQGYNILALHTQWQQEEVEKVLGEGAKYVTILRDPVEQFESLYNYVHFEKTFQMDLEQFISDYIAAGKDIPRVKGYLGRNQQLWDLGMTEEDMNNEEAVKNKIDHIDKEFDLVMIADDIESSLVLLSDILCWPLVNMTSLRLNTRKQSAVKKLSEISRLILKDWLWADYMLYDHFRGKLEKKKKSVGSLKMKKADNKFQYLNKNVEDECVVEVVEDTEILSSEFVPWSNDVLGFKIDDSKQICKYFGISENHFIEHLRSLQMERFQKWRSNLESRKIKV